MANKFYPKRQLSKDSQAMTHALLKIQTLERAEAKIRTQKRQLFLGMSKIHDRMVTREMESKRHKDEYNGHLRKYKENQNE